MKTIRIGILSFFFVISLLLCLNSFQRGDLESTPKIEDYHIDHSGNLYYLWNGFPEGPLWKPGSVEEAYTKFELFLTKVSPKGRIEYSIGGISGPGVVNHPHYKLMEDNGDQSRIYLVANKEFSYEFTVFPYPFAVDQKGNVVWKQTNKDGIDGYPVGVFGLSNGHVLYFASYGFGNNLRILHLYGQNSEEDIVFDKHIESKEGFEHPSYGNLRIVQLNSNRYLVVGYISTEDRDRLFNMKTEGDYYHIYSLICDANGKIVRDIEIVNCQGIALKYAVKWSEIAADGYFRNSDYLIMPDSSICFLFGVGPKNEKEKLRLGTLYCSPLTGCKS